MSEKSPNHWNRREFLQGMGATAAGMALSSCAINADRSARGLTEEALAVEQVVDPKTLEKPDLTVGYVPVNDCAPFAIAWKKGFFRKYGLNVKLNRLRQLGKLSRRDYFWSPRRLAGGVWCRHQC
ncbi:MAG: substrate-binding domain-containing protein [Oscillatoria sp. Prado101]|jgi:nitrate/nitrite transport system substrate-binding protein|nr:substrate-binding domain-containing protein [Oscillatoria sp. Prado101]